MCWISPGLSVNVDRLRELFTKPYGMPAPTESQWRELYDEKVRFKDPTPVSYTHLTLPTR